MLSACPAMSTSACPHQQRRLQRRLRETAERAARGHRADEHTGVEEVLGQADPVAQHRAAAERRRRVDREHADLSPKRAPAARKRSDQSRLARTRGAREAHDPRPGGVRVDLAHELPAGRVIVRHQCDRARERATVTAKQTPG